jgi:hypothetical protein
MGIINCITRWFNIDPQPSAIFCVFANAHFIQKFAPCCGQINHGVISTAGLSKFNIIPKAFIPNTASILLLQKAKH